MKRPAQAAPRVHQLPAWRDNYIYVLEAVDRDELVVFDPTDATPVIQLADKLKKKVVAIYNTHHHPDHISGNLSLRGRYTCDIFAFAPDAHRIPGATRLINDGDALEILGRPCQVLFAPGHTTGHICYFFPEDQRLFCGDVMFAFGCGRLFEGTPAEMLQSLKKITALPNSTTVYCCHEYTVANLEFCCSLEPENQALQKELEKARHLRGQDQATVPFRLEDQKRTSSFLRWSDPQLHRALQLDTPTDLEVFTRVRREKDLWK